MKNNTAIIIIIGLAIGLACPSLFARRRDRRNYDNGRRRDDRAGRVIGSTLLGAGTGAALGGIIGGGRGAGIGAGIGAATGFMAGAASADDDYYEDRYDDYDY